MDDETKRQVAHLALRRDVPLIICDVDEVVLHFVRGFERWLKERDLWLDPASYEFEGNVRRRADNRAISDTELSRLLEDFFHARIGALEAIEGAQAALEALAGEAQVVMLTNLPHVFYQARRRNLERHGMAYPLVTNSGPKGPAVRAISEKSSEPVVFIDDYPAFLESAKAHHPDAELVHFLHDPRFAPHARQVEGARARVNCWDQARQVIVDTLNGRS